MRGVALRSLVHERGKAAASLLGVACASALLFVEIGLRSGLEATSSALVRRTGGDVWLVARGTEVLDNGQAIAPESVERLRSEPCVRRVRELVVAIVPVKKKSGALDYVQIVGSAAGETPALPWSWASGGPPDVHGLRVTVDEGDAKKLQLPLARIGSELSLGERTVTIAATTRGIRSFALVPYIFADLDGARALAGLAPGAATYAVADVRSPACVSEVIAAFASDKAVEVHTTAAFARMTERFWMEGSGAGATIAASALFSLLVGAVTVGQTLYSLTRDHLRELATLKAMGATIGELVSFVVWQTATLASSGGLLGFGIAVAVQRALEGEGVTMSLSRDVLIAASAAIVVMCFSAAIPSVLRVRRVSALEVLR